MGNKFGKEMSDPLSSNWLDVRENVQDDTLNGFNLSGVFVPEDLLEEILSYTSPDSILALTKVCRVWKDITIRRSFWKLVFEKNKRLSQDWSKIPDAVKEKPFSWMVLHAACRHEVFRKNYVKNHSGEEEFTNWVILRNGGNQFRIEAPPVGISPLPFDKQFEGLNDVAFVTSFDWCSKQQKIDLWGAGLTPAVMKTLLPFEFVCSEMVGARFDCGIKWRMHICLGDTTEKIWTHEIQEEGTQPASSEWQQVSLTLQLTEDDYNKLNDIRYLMFTHHGKDSQFWSGHYGSKFSRVSVRINCLPAGSVPSRPNADSQVSSFMPHNANANEFYLQNEEEFDSQDEEEEEYHSDG